MHMFKHIYGVVFSEKIRSIIRNIRNKGLRGSYIYFETLFGIEKYPYKKYCDKHKCIFIHIPKNAGTSVITLLNDNKKIEQEHNTYWDYIRSDPIRFRTYEKFCIVRNPWDRLLSGYHYLKNGGNKGSDKYLTSTFNSQCKDFNDFVMNWLTFDRIYGVTVLNPQFIYIYDFHNEKIVIENVLRFESLSKDFLAIKNSLGISDNLRILNRSGKSEIYSDFYTDEMAERISEFYSFDINLFNYKFEKK
ncbi:MAG: sulfotransferase family 2 domain-containing protein [Candidatus Sedimenticola sp. (ex Thyasira tokunagai)]